MTDRRPPYHRRPTRPMERVMLAPIAPAPGVNQDDVETMTRCPLCHHGIVSIAVAATFEELLHQPKERA
jgi:hypothetical protein